MPNVANPTLQDLNILIGAWQVDVVFPSDPPTRAVGRVVCEWLEGGACLIMRQGAQVEDQTVAPPSAVSVVGRDDQGETYTVLYFDDRGVSRVYLMSLAGGEWRQWRAAPGFSQRFIGTISADGNTITARWEKSSDGTTWEHDFDLTYTRVGSPGG